jgi:mRNA-degrading endonuclease HigB of HigAB toxin-antitoxin module
MPTKKGTQLFLPRMVLARVTPPASAGGFWGRGRKELRPLFLAVARPSLAAAGERYPTTRPWLAIWWRVASKSRWTRLSDVRLAYRDADEVGQCLVFNACENSFRLVCRVTYANRWTDGMLLVKHFLTHSEYDKNKWCKDCIPPEDNA